MKRCPQCSSVYNDDVTFCLIDGEQLIDEVFPLPSSYSGDEATVIRSKPIVVDLSAENIWSPQAANYQIPPATENVIAVPIKTAPSSRNYALFLVLGLLLGGGLVLGTLLLAKNFYQNDNRQIKINANVTQTTPKTNSNMENLNSAANQNKSESNLSETTTVKHNSITSATNDEFNGRVIATNARVRSAPSKNSSQTDVLPMNDRINIERRENPNSPWYYVVCEHGISGWMHGDTIEFTKE